MHLPVPPVDAYLWMDTLQNQLLVSVQWHKQTQGRNSAQEKRHFYLIEETPGWDFAVAAGCLLPAPGL